MQTWDPEEYATHARFVSELGAPLVDMLDPQAGERVLDLGCGDGALTERIVAAGCRVVGVDSSPEQVWAALERGLDARIVDATELPFEAAFDAVFSNAVLHWIKDADRLLAGVWKALSPGGRFIAEMGGRGCVQTIRTACHEVLTSRGVDPDAHDPWYFPTVDDYQGRLEHQGFRVDSITRFPRPTPLQTDVSNWLRIFARPFLDAVPAQEQTALVTEIRAKLEPQLVNAEGVWVADYVRLRFSATRPDGAEPPRP